MTTGTETKATAAQAAPASNYAILFLLEGLGGSLHQATFDVLKSILGEQGLKFTPAHMSRFCLHHNVAHYLSKLLAALGASRQPEQDLQDDIKSGVEMQLASKARPLADKLRAVLAEASGRGAGLASLTALPEETAQALMKNLGLSDLPIRLVCMTPDPENGPDFPRADSWLKLAKSLKKNPLHCGVLAASKASCKSALSAGMRCIVVPDAFSAFQDFSGADAVVDDLAEIKVGELADILCPTEGA